MPSYVTVTSNGLFSFKSFEDRDVQKSAFQDYFKTNHIAGSSEYPKMFNEIIQGA